MNRYELSNIIGKINQSGIFLGVDKASGERVAVKLFSNVTETQKENLLRDAKILQNLSHPNTVKILDSGVDDGNNVYYVMEYLEGTPLFEVVPKDQGLSFKDSWLLIEKLANALSAVHKAGVLHLDLKPGNILIVDGEPKIIDFGVLIPPTPGNFRGTPGYVAPEIILGNKPTIQSDIYSFGALLAFIWTGHNLYQGDSAEKTLAHQLKNLSAKLVNPDLERVIARASKQDPARRYATLEEMLMALSLYNHELDSKAKQPSEDLAQTQGRRWVIGIIMITLVCIAAGIYYSLLNSI